MTSDHKKPGEMFMGTLVRAIPVICINSGRLLGYAEGNLRKAIALQVQQVRRRKSLAEHQSDEVQISTSMAHGCDRAMRETRHHSWDDDSLKGEDRSWKYNRCKPLGRTLCKRQRRKARYH